jgi:DNA (cytosine-5)-methyltransferase 1
MRQGGQWRPLLGGHNRLHQQSNGAESVNDVDSVLMADDQPVVVELFAGCGGLSLGLASSGFRHIALLENDNWACETLKRNSKKGGWEESAVRQEDARTFDFKVWADRVDVCAAGVPCQPFSHGGLGNGHEDDRNLFPALLRAIRQMHPKSVLVENVFGLLRPSFEDYFDYILDQLRLPELFPRDDEPWRSHWERLRKYLIKREAEYLVDHRTLEAANFGTAQLRRRVFIQALRIDLGIECEWPDATHSESALLASQANGSYWLEHGRKARVIRCQEPSVGAHALARWRTVRDAIRDLGPPSRRVEPEIANHRHVPGARLYHGHTGTRMDQPAKTIKAGVHGVAGGEGTLICDNGKARYFTVREAARLQDLEDDYWLPESRTIAMRQIGNAVPLRLATALGRVARDVFTRSDTPAAASCLKTA